MSENYQTIAVIKAQYPNEWVLLGNPKMEEIDILGGIVLYHHSNKKELANAKELVKKYEKVTHVYTGTINPSTTIGILKSV